MSIFGSIVNAIFGTAKAVGGAVAGTVAVGDRHASPSR